jgi:hypothetical protein
MSLRMIEAQITWELEYAEKRLAEFQASFAKDPLYAFGWSHDAFRAAAVAWCYKDALNGLKAKKEDGTDVYPNTVEGTVAFCREVERVMMSTALREVQYPSHSTSVQSNEVEREKASAAFNCAKKVKDWATSLLRSEFVKAAKERVMFRTPVHPNDTSAGFTHCGVSYRAARKFPGSKFYVTLADDKLIAEGLGSLEAAIDFARGRAANAEYEASREKRNAD